jgi:hypothetical protein
VKNTQNIEKSLSFNPSLGRRNSFLGRGLATPILRDNFLLSRTLGYKRESQNLKHHPILVIVRIKAYTYIPNHLKKPKFHPLKNSQNIVKNSPKNPNQPKPNSTPPTKKINYELKRKIHH